MGDNLVRGLARREVNGVFNSDRWLVADMLEELYFEECLFDHPYLLTLHEFIKTLTFLQ